jgi:PadR family transcriptional regulator, regulatory protein PadR
MSTDLGIFELLVLMAVRATRGASYGVPIRQAVAASRGRDVSSGAGYTTLERLQRRGLVTSHLGEATTARGNRPRRYYALTREGTAAVESNYAALQQLARRMTPRAARS